MGYNKKTPKSAITMAITIALAMWTKSQRMTYNPSRLVNPERGSNYEGVLAQGPELSERLRHAASFHFLVFVMVIPETLLYRRQ